MQRFRVFVVGIFKKPQIFVIPIYSTTVLYDTTPLPIQDQSCLKRYGPCKKEVESGGQKWLG